MPALLRSTKVPKDKSEDRSSGEILRISNNLENLTELLKIREQKSEETA